MPMIGTFCLYLACVAGMALPADAPSDVNADDATIRLHDSETEDYRFDFAWAGADAATLRLTVSRADGSLVPDAQVVIALIDRRGRRHLTRALTTADGYRVETGPLAADLCRVEAEVITGGQLLTDHFTIIQPS